MKRKLIIAGVILAVLLIVPFLIPTASYLPKAEQMATDALGVPVRIGGLRFALLPTPRAYVRQLEIGKDADITVAEIVAVPTLSSLFSATKQLSQVKLVDPVIKQSGVDFLLAFAGSDKKDTSEAALILVRSLIVSNAKVDWPALMIPEFDAELALSENNQPQEAHLSTADGKLKLDANPQAGSLQITLYAKEWQLPVGLPIVFERLESKMQLADENLQIESLNGSLLGGSLEASGMLGWQKNWQSSVKFKVANLSTKALFAALGKKAPLTGQLFASGTAQSKAKTADKLADNLAVDSQFKIENGVLQGVDLLKVASLLLKSGAGGETKFDTFTGNAQVRGKQYKLSNLNVQSGLMGATGHVTVAPSKALSGEVKVEVKKSASMVAIPMNVSGTLDSPMVFPTKSALIGGALGTAVLPGAGTAAGVQAAEKAEKVLKGLFGD